MFNGVFNELTIEQTVALVSCLVFDEKVTPNSPSLRPIPYLSLSPSLVSFTASHSDFVSLLRLQSDEPPKLKDELGAPLRQLQ